MSRQFLLILVLTLAACGSGQQVVQSATGAERPRGAEAEWLFTQGTAAAARGDSVRAEQYLTLARDRGYPAERVLPALLKVCLGSSRLRAALDYAEPHLRQHPQQDALRFLVANIHVGLGQPDEALAELGRLTDRNPRFERAYFLRALLLSERDAAGAIEALRAYLDLAPRGEHAAEARGRLSELLVREAEIAGAISPSQEATP
ncbi:MAG TPA: tetratricopeptide repeat protein [Polyangiaceae bacterium]|nr:tetratricopeptide repeat protein [Polyangiaceae bacterium]